MGRMDILGKLVKLSQEHVRLVGEEKWDEWEKVAGLKIDLYSKILNECAPPYSRSEEILISDVYKLEKETTELIRKKREDTKEELKSVALIKSAFSGYMHTKKANSRKNHIRFEI
jgi:hypothetical protein